jgi:IS5 family transposase
LKVAKKRRPSRKGIRKAIKKQLQYIKRNLSHIDHLMERGSALEVLSNSQYKSLLVVAEVYRQQQWIYENRTSRIDGRIVSLSQPHIRPIVRGKAGTSVEFGAKLSASIRDGYVFLDRISWDNFNELGDFKAQVEAFKEATGVYPESVHVERIYRTRSNRTFCKEKGIRISDPPLGRPPAFVSNEKKKQAREDERVRNAIEGKFGVSKRRFSLNRVMAKLPQTSQTAIAITFLVMNLSTLLRQFFVCFCAIHSQYAFFYQLILIRLMLARLSTTKAHDSSIIK